MKGYGQKRYLQKMISLIETNDPFTTNVVLNGFEIIDAKLAVMAMALVNNTYVKRLHLDKNTISDIGATLLAYVLQQNKTLEFLSLNDNDIQSAGVETIAVALYENETLRTLRLANNFISNHGGKKLRKMLRRNATIRELVLVGNNISQEIANTFDDRCWIKRTMDSARDTIPASIAVSDFTPHTNPEADDTTGNYKDDKEESNNSSLEWAASSAMSLFSASNYMNDYDARKYIIGCENSARDSDFNSSWNNLASYMMNVQETIDQREKEEVDNGNDDTISTADDDDLSIVSAEQDQVPITAKGKQNKKWSKFKKTLSSKKLHAQHICSF